MNISVSGHQFDVTPALRSYVDSKLARVGRHFDHVIDAHVILSVEKLRQKAEATLHVRGKDIHCESVQEDLYAAIDLLADKLDRQVLKYKELHTPGSRG
jgi:putative sigma-54 modulation protein